MLFVALLSVATLVLPQDEIVRTRRPVAEASAPSDNRLAQPPETAFSATARQDCMFGGQAVACPQPAPAEQPETAARTSCTFGGRPVLAAGCPMSETARVEDAEADPWAEVDGEWQFGTGGASDQVDGPANVAEAIAAAQAAQASDAIDAPSPERPTCRREQHRRPDGSGFTIEMVCGSDDAAAHGVLQRLRDSMGRAPGT